MIFCLLFYYMFLHVFVAQDESFDSQCHLKFLRKFLHQIFKSQNSVKCEVILLLGMLQVKFVFSGENCERGQLSQNSLLYSLVNTAVLTSCSEQIIRQLNYFHLITAKILSKMSTFCKIKSFWKQIRLRNVKTYITKHAGSPQHPPFNITTLA